MGVREEEVKEHSRVTLLPAETLSEEALEVTLASGWEAVVSLFVTVLFSERNRSEV